METGGERSRRGAGLVGWVQEDHLINLLSAPHGGCSQVLTSDITSLFKSGGAQDDLCDPRWSLLIGVSWSLLCPCLSAPGVNGADRERIASLAADEVTGERLRRNLRFGWRGRIFSGCV